MSAAKWIKTPEICIQILIAHLVMDKTYLSLRGRTGMAQDSSTMVVVKPRRTAGTIWDIKLKYRPLRISKCKITINNGRTQARIQEATVIKWIFNLKRTLEIIKISKISTGGKRMAPTSRTDIKVNYLSIQISIHIEKMSMKLDHLRHKCNKTMNL